MQNVLRKISVGFLVIAALFSLSTISLAEPAKLDKSHFTSKQFPRASTNKAGKVFIVQDPSQPTDVLVVNATETNLLASIPGLDWDVLQVSPNFSREIKSDFYRGPLQLSLTDDIGTPVFSGAVYDHATVVVSIENGRYITNII